MRLHAFVSVACVLLPAVACSSSGSSPPAGAPPPAASSSEGGAQDADVAASADAADDASPIDQCPPGSTAGDFPLDVAAVIKDKCQACHTMPPREHAPFPLVDYEETRLPDPILPYKGQPIWRAMHAVIQPNGVPHMPLAGAPQLTPQEFATLDGWLTSCADPVPEGTGGDADSAIADAAPAADVPADDAPADGAAD